MGNPLAPHVAKAGSVAGDAVHSSIVTAIGLGIVYLLIRAWQKRS